MARSLGEHLRYLRYTRNWTKSKLSEESGVPIPTISQVERGKREGENLTLATVRRLAKGFGITVQELIDGTEEVTKESEQLPRESALV